jgi:hypothetical protein
MCYSLNILKNIDNNVSATRLQTCAEYISVVNKILRINRERTLSTLLARPSTATVFFLSLNPLPRWDKSINTFRGYAETQWQCGGINERHLSCDVFLFKFYGHISWAHISTLICVLLGTRHRRGHASKLWLGSEVMLERLAHSLLETSNYN